MYDIFYEYRDIGKMELTLPAQKTARMTSIYRTGVDDLGKVIL